MFIENICWCFDQNILRTGLILIFQFLSKNTNTCVGKFDVHTAIFEKFDKKVYGANYFFYIQINFEEIGQHSYVEQDTCSKLHFNIQRFHVKKKIHVHKKTKINRKYIERKYHDKLSKVKILPWKLPPW